MLAAALALAAPGPGSGGFVLSDPSSEVYYLYAVVAGEEVKLHGEGLVTGDLHSNEKAELKKNSTVDGDVSAVVEVKNKGVVPGSVVGGAAPLDLPLILPADEWRAVADRVFEKDQTFEDVVIDDVVFVEGKARIRGSINGVGTIIASRGIRIDDGDSDDDSDESSDGDSDGDSDEDSDRPPIVLDDETRLSLISLDSIEVGKDRRLRAILRAARDIVLKDRSQLEGVLIADRKAHLRKDARVTFLDFDQVAPVIVLVTPVDGSFVPTPTPEIVVEYSDDFSGLRLDSLEFLLDGVDRTADAAASDTGFSFTPEAPLAEGAHTIEVAITDHSDNEGRATFGFTVDLTPPALAISAPAAVFLNDSTPAIVVDYADALSGVELTTLSIRIDGTELVGTCAVAAASAVCEAPPLAEGDHLIEASLSDRVGNSAAASFAFTLDTTPPTIAITAPLDPFISEAAPELVVSYADDRVGVDTATLTVLADGVDVTASCTVAPAGATCQLVGLGEGSHTLAVSIEDRAGNSASDSVTPVVDLTPPEIVATPSPAANAAGWNSTTVTVSFTCDDLLSGIVACPDPVTLTAEGAGQEVTGTVFDHAGNSASATVTVNIDLTPPTIAGLADPAANAQGWNNGDVTVSFDCQDALSGIASCTAPVTTTSEGADQVVAGTAVDLAGNSASASVTFSIDRTPPTFDPAEFRPLACPEVTLELLPQVRACFADALAGVDSSSVTLSVDGVDRTADSTLAAGCIAWDPLAPLAPGEHLATILATDLAGNTDSADWCFDVVPPVLEISIDSPSTGLVTATATVDVSGTVEAAADTVTVNGVVAVVSAGTFEALGVPLREGRNTLTAVATNAVGAIGTDSIQVTLDTAPPVVLIETPRAGAVLTSLQADVAGLVNDVIIGTTINADDCEVFVNGIPAEVSNRSFVVTDLLLQRGPNTLTAEARDRVGNVARTSIQVTVQDQAGQRIRLLAGNNQTGGIFDELATSLVVVLEDANGDPVPGRPVRFEVSRGDGTVRSFPQEGSKVTVLSDDVGQASVRFAVGGRSGPGNNRVLATAAGFLGEVEFCAAVTAGAPVEVTTVSGGAQTGVTEQNLPLPLVVLVTDAGGNPVGGVDLDFEVIEGGGSFDGDAITSRTTDLDGLAQAVWTLGADEGINNNVALVSLADPLAAEPTTFTASGRFAGRAVDTRLVGIVLDNQDLPVPGATLNVEGTSLSAVADAEGQFAIADVPVGSIRLLVDATTTSRPGEWPHLEFDLTTIAGRDNTVGGPIYVLPIDVGNAALAGGSEDVTLLMDNIPGAELTIFADSVTCPDGSSECVIAWTQVRGERVPMPPPLGSSFMLAWTVQPAGTHFDPPARICIPNADLLPGAQVEIFSFDHDLADFVVVGTATVTEDGAQICSDPGFGVIKSGWGGCVPPPPPEKCVGGCDDDNPCPDDRCVDGRCVHERNIPEGESCHEVEIEAEAIDQDERDNTTFEGLGDPATVYGGSEPQTSDNLKLTAETDADVPVTSYTWSVTGPGSGNYSPSSSETWDVGEIDPTPGTLEFKVMVQFADGESAEDTLEVEVGIRTDDYVVIGWIDPNGVPLSGAGMGAGMLRYYPLTGAAGMSNAQKLLTTAHLGLLAAGSDIHPVVARSMTAAEKTHTLNWMFKFAANFCTHRCPPTTFADDAAVVSFRTTKRTSYKLFNRYQVKYLTDNGVTFKGSPIVIKQATAIGVTNNPVFDFEEAGAAGPNEGRRGTLSNNTFLINDGTPTGLAVRAFNTLADPLKWNHIGSRIEFSPSFGTDGMVFNQVYPTYYIFRNLTLIDTRPQAPNPIGNFNATPYPPGPAPFVP